MFHKNYGNNIITLENVVLIPDKSVHTALVQSGVLSPPVSDGYPSLHILPWLLLVHHIDAANEDEEDGDTEAH